MLFFEFYLFCFGDSHIFGETVIASGALDLQKPDIFLMDLDAFDVFRPCRKDDAEIGHVINISIIEQIELMKYPLRQDRQLS